MDRTTFAHAAASCQDKVAELALRLVASASPNPPNDTRVIAQTAAALLTELIPDAEVVIHPGSESVVNIVARVRAARPGRRMIFNGHLDTFPVGDPALWSANPAGEVRDGMLFGRGAADMKGGIACSMMALALLAEHRALWSGEAVLVLGGDEETMGPLGTKYLIDTVPHAIGDAAIVGDAGSPLVLRFGEKGFLWIEIEAVGRAAHGAHVHLGVNAVDRLRAALDVLKDVRALPVDAPVAVTEAIAAAKALSESLCGPGECDVLSSVTVNVARMQGGSLPNLVPDSASAAVDIRLPIGVPTAAARAALHAALAGREGIKWHELRCVEPNYTDPHSEIVRRCASVAAEVSGTSPAVNMRVGGSDARLYRAAGVPTVVYGPTPHNMGAADEYVLLDELGIVTRVHALTALDFLSP
jgi:acetylornithine deacetylase/succinyl-diaminopimelate desuccinylase-like protein